jgi:hypothetical protein
MDQGAMNYVVRVLVQRILALILFWLGTSCSQVRVRTGGIRRV